MKRILPHILLTLAFGVLPGTAPAAEVDFEKQIRPLLKARCGQCHGPEEQNGGLRLDARHAAFKGGDSGEVIVPGKGGESELLRRVMSDDEDERMPPESPPLPKNEVELLSRWINGGADWPETEYDRKAKYDRRLEHWAFQPLGKNEREGLSERNRNPIDVFVGEKLQENDLAPSPEASRRTLVRRLSFDMLGLPPMIEDVRSFEADDDPRAWEKLVEKTLKSLRYGERWAQHWLDVIRYADTHGFEVNTPRENAWPYRDYVIRSFNEDKPYDQFVVEQLAGDALQADQATGFLVAAAVLLPGQIGKDDESKRLARQDALDEIIQGTGATLLGLTIGCARCHDHKFDPITQRDYYAMQAFFAGVEYGDRPIIDAAHSERLAEAVALALRIRKLEGDLRLRPPTDPRQGDEHIAPAEISSLVAELERLKAKKKDLETPRMIYGGTFDEPETTYVLRRGDPEQPIEAIGPAVPALFAVPAVATSMAEQERRLALARWIVSPENPLSARVMVNRIWMYHFGQGLVATPSDFGLNGSRPSHPELLDWLAGEFIRSGWSIKHIQRLILTSRTYRQSHRIDPASAKIDRDNKWLWRFAARRLESEAIRDSMLVASGELNLKMGGPGFNFFKSRGGLSGFPPIDEFGPEQLRRMIYAHKIRMEPVPVFGAFDCPDAGQATPLRSQSTTAIQALNLFNSRFVADRAVKFASRVKTAAAGDVDHEVTTAFEVAFGREPTEIERHASFEAVRKHGLATLCRVLFNSNEFLFMP